MTKQPYLVRCPAWIFWLVMMYVEPRSAAPFILDRERRRRLMGWE